MKLFNKKENRKIGKKRTTPITGFRVSPETQTFLIRAAMILAAFGVCAAGHAFFKKSYMLNPKIFNLGSIRKNVTMETGKTIHPDMICESFGLKNNIAAFSVDIEKQRKKLMTTPNVKEVEIIRTLPDKLSIRIKERDPLARISAGPRGLVADEEGVAFVQHAGNNILPLIRVSDEFNQIKPSDRLSGMEMNAIRVLQQAARPGFKLRIAEIDARNGDYLTIIFSDYRKADFAWKGMSDPKIDRKTSDASICSQLDGLAQAMESEIGRPRQLWDATIPGRPVAKSIIN